MIMNKVLIALAGTMILSGCATPQQNAVLTGAVVGYVIGASINAPDPLPPYRQFCYSTTYRDQFGNLIKRTTCKY